MKKEFGLRIKNIREGMNLTKEEFARLIGISGQYLGLIERGQNYLSIDKLKKLCDLTNLSSDYILFGRDNNIVDNTKSLLSEFSQEQIAIGCEALKKLSYFIKSEK